MVFKIGFEDLIKLRFLNLGWILNLRVDIFIIRRE